MPYPVYSILPYERSLAYKNGIFEEIETAWNLSNVPIHYLNEGGIRRSFTAYDLGLQLGFIYRPYLTFVHEKELRNCCLLGLDETAGLPTAESLNIVQQLESGGFHDAIYIKKVGIHDNIDIGHGVYAADIIPDQCMIGEYTGIVSSGTTAANRMGDSTGAYSVYYPGGDSCLEINAASEGNVMRLVNHSITPNCSFVHILHDHLLHVICMTQREISAHEQLTVNYGESYWIARSEPPVDMHT